MNRSNPRFLNFLALLLGLMAAFMLGMMVLEIYFGKNRSFYVHVPNSSREFHFLQGSYIGCPDKYRYSTNRQGMRGDDYPTNPFTYRILAMGGSTTICGSLDDSQTWPALLQNELPRTTRDQSDWVGNIGRSGLTTRGHVLQMRYFVPQYSVDAILLLTGINDLMLRLTKPDHYDPYFMQSDENRLQLLLEIFDIVPDSLVHPFYKSFGIWKLARQVKSYLKNRFNRNIGLAGLKIWRNYRRHGRQVTTAPDLTGALEEYVRNLTEIITLAKQQNVRLIMMTQPVLWDENMTQEEHEALVFGFIGDAHALADHPYYSAEVLAQGMKLYNQKLLQLCRQYKVEYIDLAAALPRNLQVMYDDCHFTALGAQLVAGLIVDYLRTKPPFAIGEQENRHN